MLRETWVEVDLDCIVENFTRMRERVGASLLVVVKANAYGHGAVAVSRALERAGVAMLGVAFAGEAAELRGNGIESPILVMGHSSSAEIEHCVRMGVDVAVSTPTDIKSCARAALATGRLANVHLEVDTGMGRLGVFAGSVLECARLIASLPGVQFRGLFTHFASADQPDLRDAEAQLAAFASCVQELEELSLRPPKVHCANSPAALRLPAARFDMVRVGITIYGLSPEAWYKPPIELRPALVWKARLASVRELPAGHGVSYGSEFRLARDGKIGVLPVGYSDGFRRSPKGVNSVLIRGQEFGIAGRVCMDLCMVDLGTACDFEPGAECVLLGAQGGASLSAFELARRWETNQYDVISSIASRVPRHYLSSNTAPSNPAST